MDASKENKDPEKSIGRIKMDSGGNVEGNLKPSLTDVDTAVKSAGVKIISSSDSPSEGGGLKDVISYSSEELSDLRNTPLTTRWPSFLDEAYKSVKTGNWDPDMWHQKKKPPGIDMSDIKTSKDSTSGGSGSGDRPSSASEIHTKKSLKDPKDRLKAGRGGEGGAGGSGGGGGLVLGPGGGLVLSPQRRSFNTGCQMLTAPTHPTQANEGKDGDGGGRMREIGEMKERMAAVRRGNGNEERISESDSRSGRNGGRVGSGRIISGRGDGPDDRFGGGGGRFGDRDYRRGRGGDEDEGEGRGGGGRGGGGYNSGPSGGPNDKRSWFERRNHDRYNSEGADGDGPGDRFRRGHVQGRHGERDYDGGRGGRFGGGGGRGGGRDYGNGRDHGHRYGQRRSETEEPEWMSESVNQDELMELHGFDDSPEKESSAEHNIKQRITMEKGMKASDLEIELQQQAANQLGHRQAAQDQIDEEKDAIVKNESPATHQVGPGGDILGDILQLDSIPGLANLLNDDGFDTEPPTVSRQMNQPMSNQANSAAPGGGGSRFSQFFQQKQLKDKTPSPLLPHLHQQRPPASDEIAKQFNQHQQAPKVRIPSPGDPSACFAPISPAAPVHSSSNSADQAANTSESSSNPLMEMLKGRAGDAPPSSGGSWGDNNPEALASRLPGKVMSVEELEAQQQQQPRVLGGGRFPSGGPNDHHSVDGKSRVPAPIPMPPQPNSKRPQEDMSAFNKLAAMLEMNQENEGIKPAIPQHPGAGDGPQRQQRSSGGSGGLVRPMPVPPFHPAQQPMTEDELLRQQQQHPVQPAQQLPLTVPRMAPPPPHPLPQHHNPVQVPPHLQQQPQPRQPPVVPPPNQGPPSDEGIRQGMLELIHQAPLNVEVLKRPEAQSLQACVERGGVAPNLLLHQFIHGNLGHYQREVLLNVLKVVQTKGGLGPVPSGPGGPGGPLGPPRPNQQQPPPPQAHQKASHPLLPQAPPQPQPQVRPKSGSPEADQLMMLMQQAHQQQQENSRNTLAVSPSPATLAAASGRVPSPQELMVHTQQIMQSALIKRKLKEQEDSYRKRQQQQQSDQKPENTSSAATTTLDKSSPSPSSLAFAPTVVMKKMAADRRDSDPKLLTPQQQKVGGHAAQEQQANSNTQQQQLGQAAPHPPLPHGDSGNDSQASAGRISPGRLMEHIRNQQQQQQAHLPPPHILLQQQQQLHQMKLLQAQQMQARMAAAAAAGMADPRFMRPRHPSSGGPAGGPLFGPPVGAGSRGPSPTTILSSGLMGGMPPMPPMPPHMPPAGHGMPGTPSGATGGLSRFFSPEVLAQANAGNAPHMPPLPTQKVLTLEEIERQAAAVRI